MSLLIQFRISQGLLSQGLVINGLIKQEVDAITLSAPDGAYPGATVFVSGGQVVIFDIGDPDFTEYEGYEDGAVAYRLYRNGVAEGDWFFGDSFVIPNTFVPGDILTVRDYAGNESEPLTIVSVPWEWNDGTPIEWNDGSEWESN